MNAHGRSFVALGTLLLVVAGSMSFPVSANDTASDTASKTAVERGRYLIQIAGCNDCHTAGYMATEGKVPEKDWLTGDSFGWRGPWGTTYGSNLRLLADTLSEEQWLAMTAHLKARPPMPWFNLSAMAEPDRKAIYAYLRHLGPAGKPAPAYVPPDREPPPPFAVFPAPAG